MTITKFSPTKVRIEANVPESEIRRQLTYIDKSVDFEYQKVKKNRWLRQRLGEVAWNLRLEELKAKRTQCLLFQDDKGWWTYAGLGKWLADKLKTNYQDKVEYPEVDLIPWASKPTKTSRWYQDKAKNLLLEEKHGAVEIGTGLGKTFIIQMLTKSIGLKTVVMTPSLNIANQIYEEFKKSFGIKYVGKFFDGKKESKKLFTIAVDDSLAKIDEKSDHWSEFAKTQVFIADESHLCPASTLAKVCHGLLANSPYRFFFSGTQIRNDGKDLLLAAITGDIVFRLSVQEGVDQEFLAKPKFRMVPINGTCDYQSKDANEMTRAHLYYEPTVASKAAEIANLMVELGRQTVVLVKELEQFQWLLPYFRHEVKFAHGGVTEANRKLVPEKYWESDPSELVKSFNEGEFPILVGTSCITTGTDIQTVGAIIYLQGGKSEIQVKQAVGRGTRRPEGKEDCYFIDFDVLNAEVVHRHAQERAEIYKSIYPDFEVVNL